MRKAEQSAATRAALLQIARDLFAERGYADTPIEEICQRAAMTRGALYHHFRDKQEMFRAVFEDVEREFADRIIAAAADKAGPWGRLNAGCIAFLDAYLEPAFRRIMMVDGPAVLGWETWRRIDGQYGLGLLRTGLQAVMDTGLIERQPLDPLAHLLLGALNEAGMFIAHAENAKAARAQIGASVARLLQRLRVGEPALAHQSRGRRVRRRQRPRSQTRHKA